MNNRRLLVITVIVVVILLLVGGGYAWYRYNIQISTTTVPGADNTQLAGQTLTLAGGEVSIDQPQIPWALAVSADQVLVHSYIPPCEEGFDYCIYYNGDRYVGTNFESAG